jgi:hypothetical protein
MLVCQTSECIECQICFKPEPKSIRLVASNSQWVRKTTIRELKHRDIFVVHANGSTRD